MEREIVDCIPSSALREYLRVHPVELSVMQEATIASEYARRKKRISLFRKLAGRTDSEAEKLLLNTAVADLERNSGVEGGYMKATCEVYEKNFPHEGFPIFPFLEVCNLPVLFRPGDIITSHSRFALGTVYCVGSVPVLREGMCDFSDECYLCYPVSFPVRTQDDLALSHVHINICEADRVSTDTLTRKQRKNLRRIRELTAGKSQAD